MCEQLKVPVEEELLNSLVSYCDVDGDKHIDYEEFCKFLNWQNARVDELIYHQQTSQEVGYRDAKFLFPVFNSEPVGNSVVPKVYPEPCSSLRSR